MKRIMFRQKAVEKPPATVETKAQDVDVHSLIDQRLKITGLSHAADPVEQPQPSPPVPDETPVAAVEPKADPSRNTTMVNYTEKVSRFNINRAIMYFTVLGIMGIIFFTLYMEKSTTFMLLTWMFGMMCFLPLGLVIGWLFLNPDVRVRMMRMRGKNYGLVHFVHRGGQRMVTRIKNFDEDVIIQDTKMWILRNDGVYYLDKARNLLLHAKIDSSHIKTLPANIPVLYLDSDTMIPLTFHTVLSKSNPQQVGSVILGYIYNQLAKALFMKKGMQIFFIIVIVLTALTAAITVQIAMWVEETHKTIDTLMNRVARMSELISELEVMLGYGDIEPEPGGG